MHAPAHIAMSIAFVILPLIELLAGEQFATPVSGPDSARTANQPGVQPCAALHHWHNYA
jgi:hypothetical protein